MWKALIKLVEKWAYRCEHNWELEREMEKYRGRDNELIGVRITYRCTKCCEFKKQNLC